MPPSRIASALALFESNISNNAESKSMNFISNVASSPMRSPRGKFSRRRSLTTAKDIEDEYEKIVSGDFKEHPLISPTKFHRTVGPKSKTLPGLPSWNLFDDDDDTKTDSEQVNVDGVDYGYSASSAYAYVPSVSSRFATTEKERSSVVSKKEDGEDAIFYELDEEDDDGDHVSVCDESVAEESVAEFSVSSECYQEPSSPGRREFAVKIERVVIKGDAASDTSDETNSDVESETRSSLLPSFEEQQRHLNLRLRDRKPVPVSPIKLKDRMRAFQQGLTTLNAL
jgi:hypothetical protein